MFSKWFLLCQYFPSPIHFLLSSKVHGSYYLLLDTFLSCPVSLWRPARCHGIWALPSPPASFGTLLLLQLLEPGRCHPFLHLECFSALYKHSFFLYLGSQFNATSWVRPFHFLERASALQEYVFGRQTNQSGAISHLLSPYIPGDNVPLYSHPEARGQAARDHPTAQVWWHCL